MRTITTSMLNSAPDTNNMGSSSRPKSGALTKIVSETSPGVSNELCSPNLTVQVDLNQILLSAVGQYRLTYIAGGKLVTVGELSVSDNTSESTASHEVVDFYEEFTRSCEEFIESSPSTCSESDYSPTSATSSCGTLQSVDETYCSTSQQSSLKPELPSGPSSPHKSSIGQPRAVMEKSSPFLSNIDTLTMIATTERVINGGVTNMALSAPTIYCNGMDTEPLIDPALRSMRMQDPVVYEQQVVPGKNYCHFLPSKNNGRMYTFIRLLEDELYLWKVLPCHEVVLSLELLRGAIIALGHTNIRGLTIGLLNYMIPNRRRTYPYRQGVPPPGMWPKSIPYVDPPHLASRDRIALLAWCCLNEILPLATLTELVHRTIKGPHIEELLIIVKHSRDHCRKWLFRETQTKRTV